MNNNEERLLPVINSIDKSDSHILLNLSINADLKCFKGHFDDAAVVPGVVQLDWAISFSRQFLLMQGDVLDISVLKFQKLLLPDTSVNLELIKKSPKKFTFNYWMGDNKFSSARVEFS